jgi:2-aminoadipate transaminase
MLAAMERYFPSGFEWSRPEGGMFIWAWGPRGLDMVELYHRAVDRKVAFVPGTFFFAGRGQGLETLRLNFSMADEKTLDRAIRILAEVFRFDDGLVNEHELRSGRSNR